MQQQHTDEAFAFRPARAARFVDMGESTLWKFAKEDPDFPRPIKLGSRMTVFLRADLVAWIQRRAAAGQAKG